jgi:hypothetical protein
VLSKLKPSATIVFAAVAGEEQGLNGSRHLAKLAKSEGWQLEGVLNNDIVGGNTTPGDLLQNKSLVRVFSEGIPSAATPEQTRLIENLGYESDSASRELARTILEVSETYHGIGNVRKTTSAVNHKATAITYLHPVMEFRRDRFLRGGDHTSFNQEGFPAVRFTEWREDFNHQHQNVRTENGVEYGDLLKFVDFQYVAHVAALNAATLATLAYAPSAPAKVRVVTKNLDNNTTLEWEMPGGPLTQSRVLYEIVWRELSAPNWQFSAPADKFSVTGNSGTYSVTLPISKDNVIFGVRAVDAQGHRSPAVAPLPER